MPRPLEFDRTAAIEQAMRVFWERGYEATSVEDLAQATGLNRSSLYNSFGDKHALFVEALDRYKTLSCQTVQNLFSGDGSVKLAFAKLFELMVDQALDDPKHSGCFIVNTLAELGQSDAQVATVLQNNGLRMETAFEAALRRGQASGELSPKLDVKATAQYLYSAMQGLRLRGKLKPQRSVLENISRLTLAVLG